MKQVILNKKQQVTIFLVMMSQVWWFEPEWVFGWLETMQAGSVLWDGPGMTQAVTAEFWQVFKSKLHDLGMKMIITHIPL